MTEPCDLSAVDAAAEIASKELSPVELFQSCLQRINTVNTVLNAVVAIDEQTGLANAKAAEKKIMNGGATGLLCGLPVGIKDLEATAGLRTTWGSMVYEHEIPTEDDKMVADIKAAGGNVFCKTNTPEFGAGGNTKNKVYGPTGNPFDPLKTCAGSSGGTAVALATNMMPVATGSDYGGSLRTPAAFCGITGFRPSPGVVPGVHSGVALSPFPVLGPMGRTVADTHLLLRVQSGFDRRDPFSNASLQIQDDLLPTDLDSVRAAWSADLGCCPVDNKIRELFTSRVSVFGSEFKECDERSPELKNVHNVFEVLRGLNFVAGHAERLRDHRELLGPNVIDNTERGLALTVTEIAEAFSQQSVLYRDTIDFFDNVDVLICPAASVSPFPHSELTVREINGEKMPTYMRWLALSYAPTTTLCCSCVLPCGLDHEGMPFGIQVIGPNGSDSKVLNIAASLEKVLAGNEITSRPLPSLTAL